ncbi:MAG TPA: citrate/2-methylcitrate synthase, partial [Candidatus Limnocylindrales bacterium]|nr:citrate/2-methylcitrate synthase [Candidatus Limnocylindrales bacterium]
MSPDSPEPSGGPALEVHDGRTGRDYHLPIADGAIRATDLGRIGTDEPDDGGLLSYDPAFMNTASCRSAITYIDGDKGILRYRGYPIEQLAGTIPFLDVAALLVEGDLLDGPARERWITEVEAGEELPPEITDLVETFPGDAHPMAVLLAAWSALGAYHPHAKAVDDPAVRDGLPPRFVGAIAALATLVFRHRTGRPTRIDRPTGDFTERFYRSMFPEVATPDAALTRAIDVLLILQADHEQNCST